MTTKIIGTIFTTVLFISCQTKTAMDESKIADVESVVPKEENSKKIENVDSVKEKTFDASDCIRGQAEPILKKKVFPNSVFKINEDGLSGTETVELTNGDKLIITNGGCEYYVLAFRFETSRFQNDTTDVKFWSAKIIDLMNGITDGIDAPIDLKKGTMALSEYIKENQIQILQDITFEPGEIRTYMTIDRIQKIDTKRYGLEISYIVGPL